MSENFPPSPFHTYFRVYTFSFELSSVYRLSFLFLLPLYSKGLPVPKGTISYPLSRNLYPSTPGTLGPESRLPIALMRDNRLESVLV